MRLKRDVWYAERWPLVPDLKIVLLTAAGLLQRRNVRPAGEAAFDDLRNTQYPSAEGPRAFPV